MKEIGIPSVSGMTSALKSGAIGAVGGAIVGLSNKYFGTGLWGGLIGIAAAGSILKGSAGETIATVLGFDIGKNLIANGIGKTTTTTAAASNYSVI